LFAVSEAVEVFRVAALPVGREVRRLDAVPSGAVYEGEQAVGFIVALLPESTRARLTTEELNQLLVMHLNRHHDKGAFPSVPRIGVRSSILRSSSAGTSCLVSCWVSPSEWA
jgi:hypothetical protein